MIVEYILYIQHCLKSPFFERLQRWYYYQQYQTHLFNLMSGYHNQRHRISSVKEFIDCILMLNFF